jgi:hypothetical protein
VLIATGRRHAGRVHRVCAGTHHLSLDVTAKHSDSAYFGLTDAEIAEIDTLAHVEAICQSQVDKPAE